MLTLVFHSTLASTPRSTTVMFVPGLSEVEAVRLIDIILFGHASPPWNRRTRPCGKYRGQFPAMLRKMQVSYNATFPSHWTEKWLMDACSLWLAVPLSATAATENITPTNAATRQATAPVIDTPASGNQRM